VALTAYVLFEREQGNAAAVSADVKDNLNNKHLDPYSKEKAILRQATREAKHGNPGYNAKVYHNSNLVRTREPRHASHPKPVRPSKEAPETPLKQDVRLKEAPRKSTKQVTQPNDEHLQNSTTNSSRFGWWEKNREPGQPWPSLFCWSHMEAFGQEEALVRSQISGRFGIFACNDFCVISRTSEPVELGEDPRNRSRIVSSWPNMRGPDYMGNTGAGDATASYVNAATFVMAWKTLMDSGALWDHDWVVKVDPDAVFFPARLRQRLLPRTKPPHGPGPFYFLNCPNDGGRIYGSLEVYSIFAILKFNQSISECLQWPYFHWGEDLFMENCMKHLNGVDNAVRDYMLVGDDRCTQAGCNDGSRVAFHPQKTIGGYWGCVKLANNTLT